MWFPSGGIHYTVHWKFSSHLLQLSSLSWRCNSLHKCQGRPLTNPRSTSLPATSHNVQSAWKSTTTSASAAFLAECARTTVKLLVIIAHIQLSLDICHLVIIAIDVSNHHNYLPINQINMKCMCNKDSVKFVERNIFQLETSRASWLSDIHWSLLGSSDPRPSWAFNAHTRT